MLTRLTYRNGYMINGMPASNAEAYQAFEARRIAALTIWEQYEHRKAKLRDMNLSVLEYQRACRQIADELGCDMSSQISKKKREMVFHKFNCRCAYCGDQLSLNEMHIDHIYPKKNGGSNDICNLNPSCQRCNTAKGDRLLEDFRLHRMIGESAFVGVINFKQWRELNDRGVFINLPIHKFYFEGASNE